MESLDQPKLFDFAFSFSNFRCFGSAPTGLKCIKPINIVIGRNNSGKSTLIDCIRSFLLRERRDQLAIHVDTTFRIESLAKRLPDARTVVNGYYNDRSGLIKHLSQNEHWCFTLDGDNIIPSETREIARSAVNCFSNDLKGMLLGWRWISISAERDFGTEEMGGVDLANPFRADGRGFTRFFEYVLNDAAHNKRQVIEEEFVSALNDILHPDNSYKRILVNRTDQNVEIYLDEIRKGKPIPLSATGSGVKTILQVLGNLILVPAVTPNFDHKKVVFGFEELENNLHPSTVRRLFDYIKDYATKKGCTFFITTHSHIVVDQFASSEAAQIIHVTHDGQFASVQTIDGRSNAIHILDDLGVKASDLFQTNVVVWVEGPSDAMYFEKWMDLHSNGSLRRGIDYQCVAYGGDKCASHMTFSNEDVNRLIECSKICRNNVFLIDSNKNSARSQASANTDRLVQEVSSSRGIAWITEGREVENYLPMDEFDNLFATNLTKANKYVDVFKAIRAVRGIKTEERKVPTAHKMIARLKLENLYRFDLKERLQECDEFIRRCNSKGAN